MAMSVPSPHYLLFSEACHSAQQGSAWRFVLESVHSQHRFAATDVEPLAEGERLELLAVVRGLEAIEQPARVTLVTKSRYVSRGLKYGISDWRSNGWHWERFGKQVPVRDDDLWRRVDRALQFHRVECRAWQFADATVPAAAAMSTLATAPARIAEPVAEPTTEPSTAGRMPVAATGQASRRLRCDRSHAASQSRTANKPAASRRSARCISPSQSHRHGQNQGLATRLRCLLGVWLRPLAHRLQPLA